MNYWERDVSNPGDKRPPAPPPRLSTQLLSSLTDEQDAELYELDAIAHAYEAIAPCLGNERRARRIAVYLYDKIVADARKVAASRDAHKGGADAAQPRAGEPTAAEEYLAIAARRTAQQSLLGRSSMSTPIGEALVEQATQALHEHSQSGGIKTAETMARAVLAAVEPQIRAEALEGAKARIEARVPVATADQRETLRLVLRVVGEKQP